MPIISAALITESHAAKIFIGDIIKKLLQDAPELLEYMDEVMPKKKSECSMDSDILDTVIDVTEYMSEIEKNQK